ncbi:MAG: mechanosensitive ion channel [Gemmatimonadota bacterium]|nr:mechanosensitive ion channel [Gemmatimonadota bacterium]
MLLPDFLNRTFYGNSLYTWGTAFALFLVVAGTIALVRAIVVRRLAHLAKRTRTKADDVAVHLLGRTTFFVFIAAALIVALKTLTLTDGARGLARQGAALAIIVQFALWAGGAVSFWLDRYAAERTTDAASVTTTRAVGFAARLLIWTFAFLLALENLDVDVSTLIAGLGITGIAVALAVQNILGDLLGALSIVVDKPFVVGDFIVVDEYMGTVEHIGLKTTRLRSLSGEQIIV